jgi:apolipoprotein N-acyltransferase
VALLAAVAAGALLAAANPPPDLGPLAFVALVPLLLAARAGRGRRGGLLGFAWGLVYYGVLLHWLLRFGVIAWLPLVASQAAWGALFGGLLPRLWRDAHLLRSALLAAALWTGVDWARGVWPLGGFTWGGLGYTQHDNPLLLPLASVTGVWGVTFALVLVNGLVAGVVAGRGAALGRRAPVALASAALVALAPAAIPLPAASGPTLEVAVVQGNVPKERATDFYLRTREVARNHVSLHRELAARPPELAVWPENSLDVDPRSDPALERAVRDAVRAVGVPVLAGAITEAPGGRFHNEVLHYTPDGEVVTRYAKVHPVPFGEYVPFRRFLGWVDELRAVPRDIAPGGRLTLFEVDGVRIGTPICFENTFPDLFRRFVAGGAELMVVATNDSSYADSPASREHVIMSELRAVETARWVVQAAISGESAVIDPRGRVVARTGLFERAILRAVVPSSEARTLYVRLGDWFPWAAGLGAGVALAVDALGRRRRGRVAPPTPPAGERWGAERLAPVSGGAPRTLVVLPTYNERDTVEEVVRGVLAAGPEVDVLVVDDGSPDGTGDLVASLTREEPRVRLLQRPGKLGLASAYVEGFRRGLEEGYDLLVEMDADLSHDPTELPRLLEGARRFHLTIGSRYVPGGAVTDWSRARVALSRAGNLYTRLLLGLPVTDATSGYRAFRRAVLERLLADGVATDGYAFQIELAYRAWRAGFSVGEVPITFRERRFGRSKLSGRIVLEALLTVTRWGLQARAARLAVGLRGPLRRRRSGGR